MHSHTCLILPQTFPSPEERREVIVVNGRGAGIPFVTPVSSYRHLLERAVLPYQSHVLMMSQVTVLLFYDNWWNFRYRPRCYMGVWQSAKIKSPIKFCCIPIRAFNYYNGASPLCTWQNSSTCKMPVLTYFYFTLALHMHYTAHYTSAAGSLY